MFARLSGWALAVLGLVGGAIVGGSPRHEGTRVVFLSVGQGDSTLLRSGDWVMLVDVAARTDDFDAGERLVAPALRSMGVRRIDCLVLTHPDSDHVGGLEAVASRFAIGRVVVSRAFRNDPEMLDALGRARIGPDQVLWVEGVWRAQIGEATVTIAAPPWWRGIEPNEASLFVRIDAGGGSIGMTGDAASEVEDMMADVIDLDVDVLKAGHHGSRRSTSTAFLESTSPTHVVVSCGRMNPYGHPATAMVERVREYGAPMLRTDRDGSVEFVLGVDGFVLVE